MFRIPASFKKEVAISLEAILLGIFGIFMVLLGTLLFQISAANLAYSSDSTYGLFLLLIAIQVITMGKSPFGDFQRSWAIILLGLSLALLGMTDKVRL